MPDHRPIDRLDKKHMMAVLLFLLENGPSNRMDIYNNVSRNSNMPKKLDELVALGLLDHEVTIRGSSMRLTERGFCVATGLSVIEKTLRDQLS